MSGLTGSKDTASSISLLFRLRLRAKVAIVTRIVRPMIPTTAKTIPERILFWRKDVVEELGVELATVEGTSGKAVTVWVEVERTLSEEEEDVGVAEVELKELEGEEVDVDEEVEVEEVELRLAELEFVVEDREALLLVGFGFLVGSGIGSVIGKSDGIGNPERPGSCLSCRAFKA
ncbi:hypothetical protein CPB84DRAFT_1758284 [Gymnopilus junonius]|uniref:Uncharacterized protein n=1 Tax=Gymnopilus junonius TaxID=109634 RepID=A0A9P5P3C7_GYMJU|nr:hypothetical protein CPB84DRAFT_1758284 [Gymnopilus junonius]